MLTRTTSPITCIAAGIFCASLTSTSSAEVLYSFMPDANTITPANANIDNGNTGTRSIQATTVSGSSALYSGSMFTVSDFPDDEEDTKYQFTSEGFKVINYARYANGPKDTRGVGLWEFDFSSIRHNYNNLTLNLNTWFERYWQTDVGDIDAYISYNDVETGLKLDEKIAPDMEPESITAWGYTNPRDWGRTISYRLFNQDNDYEYYTKIASQDGSNHENGGNFILEGIDLDPYVNASDDGMIRIAIGLHAYKSDFVIYNDGNTITGTAVPEPASLALIGIVAPLLMCRRRCS